MKNIILFFLIIIIIASCHKESPSKTNSNDDALSGKIILPTGSSLNPNSLLVCSATGESSISNGTFNLDSSSFRKYSTQFVINQSDELILMRYNFTGQSNNDISSHSTALAMIMNLPCVQSLSESGKLNLIKNLESNDLFTKFVEEIDKTLLTGRPLTDSSNIELQESLRSIITLESTKSSLGSQEVLNNPITFFRSGREITLINNVACTYYIGVYKDGKRIGNLLKLRGVEFAPPSLLDLFRGLGKVPEFVQQKIDMEGDGNFELKIRSGGLDDNTIESDSALYDNRLEYIYTANKIIFSFIGPECFKTLEKAVVSLIQKLLNSSPGQNDKDIATIAASLHELFIKLLKLELDIIKNCSSIEIPNDHFFKGLIEYLKYLDLVGKVGNSLNTTARLFFLVNAKSYIDTCFFASGNNVSQCNSNVTLTTLDVNSITQTSAISGGIITDIGAMPILERGVICSLSQDPQIGIPFKSTDESANFKSLLFGLTPGKEYFASAYAINRSGTYYGNPLKFTTLKSDSCDFTFTWGPPPSLQFISAHLFFPNNIGQMTSDRQIFTSCTLPDGSPALENLLNTGIHFKMKRGDSATITWMWVTTTDSRYCPNGSPYNPDTTYITKTFSCK